MAKPAVSVEVKGVDDLRRGARTLFGNIEEGAERELLTVADQVAGMVRSRVPHRSGALAATVTADGTDKGAMVSHGGLPYSGWIEFGGGHGRPYVAEGRYLYPAAKQAEDRTHRAGESAAKQAIRSMSWPHPS